MYLHFQVDEAKYRVVTLCRSLSLFSLRCLFPCCTTQFSPTSLHELFVLDLVSLFCSLYCITDDDRYCYVYQLILMLFPKENNGECEKEMYVIVFSTYRSVGASLSARYVRTLGGRYYIPYVQKESKWFFLPGMCTLDLRLAWIDIYNRLIRWSARLALQTDLHKNAPNNPSTVGRKETHELRSPCSKCYESNVWVFIEVMAWRVCLCGLFSVNGMS